MFWDSIRAPRCKNFRYCKLFIAASVIGPYRSLYHNTVQVHVEENNIDFLKLLIICHIREVIVNALSILSSMQGQSSQAVTVYGRIRHVIHMAVYGDGPYDYGP